MLKDDSELAYVIGHEIGHIDLSHCADRAAYSIAAERIGGDLPAMLTAAVYQTVSSGYNKKQEFAADEYGVRIAQAAGFDPRSALTTLRAFLREEQNERTETGGPTSPDQRGNEFEKALEQVKHHYGTHPPTTERIANVEAVLGSLPAMAP
jgi:Zn-dependent protease with chaperone function